MGRSVDHAIAGPTTSAPHGANIVTLFSQAGQMGQEMIKDPGMYASAALISTPAWLPAANSILATIGVLFGVAYAALRFLDLILDMRKKHRAKKPEDE